MMVASGPFTLDDDISYAPLEALVDIVRVERPDVLLMVGPSLRSLTGPDVRQLGPFVDSQHPSLINGQVGQTSTEIWREQIGSRLQRIIDHSPGTHIILVPSVRDAVSRHVAYPQAMLDKELLGIPKVSVSPNLQLAHDHHQRIKALPNPSTFSLNEVVVAVSSVDVLFHLRCEELVQRAEESEPDQELKNQEVKDSMAGLVRHVLGQRSFYPIFPPPEPHASEVNLDVTHYPLLKMDGPAPDVLILPSKLKHFSKVRATPVHNSMELINWLARSSIQRW